MMTQLTFDNSPVRHLVIVINIYSSSLIQWNANLKSSVRGVPKTIFKSLIISPGNFNFTSQEFTDCCLIINFLQTPADIVPLHYRLYQKLNKNTIEYQRHIDQINNNNTFFSVNYHSTPQHEPQLYLLICAPKIAVADLESIFAHNAS